jgi:hypothetical protein
LLKIFHYNLLTFVITSLALLLTKLPPKYFEKAITELFKHINDKDDRLVDAATTGKCFIYSLLL